MTGAVDAAPGIAGLKGALQYVRAYRDRTFVVKAGGVVLGDPDWRADVAAQIGLLASLGIRVVLVHGGGPQAGALAGRLGLPIRLVGGRRVTDPATLEVAVMTYAGQVNVELLSALRAHHVQAVGLSGVDAELVTVRRRPPVTVADGDGAAETVDFGLVGDVVAVDTGVLRTLLDARFVPVVASLAADAGGRVHNVNADTIAEELAVALGALKLVFLTAAPGVLRDRHDPSSLVSFGGPAELRALLESGAVAGGMRPKVEACLRAVARGVERTHIVDGRAPDAILQEVFTGAGSGTMIVARPEAAEPVSAGAAEAGG